MKKFIFVISLFLIMTNAISKTIVVEDITKGNKITFSPGSTYFWGAHGCSVIYRGSQSKWLGGFMENASSYSYTTTVIGMNTRCTNIKTDVVDLKVTIPYVNQAAFKESTNPPKLGWAGVVFASTPEIPTIFTLTDSVLERNTMLLEAGTFGTPGYFWCEVASPSDLLDWLRTINIENEVLRGAVIDISWLTAHRHCAVKGLTFDPKLLIPPAVIVIPDPEVPAPPPVNCIP